MTNTLLRFFTAFVLCISLGACGFHLRGANEFGYKNIYVQGQTQITSLLKKSLQANGLTVTDDVKASDIHVDLMKEEYEKRILSLSGNGVVREYELYYRIEYRTRASTEPLWSEPQLIESRRDFSYSDANLLAKQSEEKRLNNNMQKEVLNNLMRRLAALNK